MHLYYCGVDSWSEVTTRTGNPELFLAANIKLVAIEGVPVHHQPKVHVKIYTKHLSLLIGDGNLTVQYMIFVDAHPNSIGQVTSQAKLVMGLKCKTKHIMLALAANKLFRNLRKRLMLHRTFVSSDTVEIQLPIKHRLRRCGRKLNASIPHEVQHLREEITIPVNEHRLFCILLPRFRPFFRGRYQSTCRGGSEIPRRLFLRR